MRAATPDQPSYLRVFLTFARNSLVRDMTFRSNFLIEAFTSLAWMAMSLAIYLLIYQYTQRIGEPGSEGWEKYQFFVFIATTILVNSVVQYMTADELHRVDGQGRANLRGEFG